MEKIMFLKFLSLYKYLNLHINTAYNKTFRNDQ